MYNIFKQCVGYYKRNKLNVAILCILVSLTSFMYFFVECSIDKNLAILKKKKVLSENEKEFLIGLNSNKILALSFLIFLLLVTAFIFYMFYKKNYDLNRKNIGCIRSLGYTNKTIISVYSLITVAIGVPSSIIGCVLGYYFSYILLDNYIISYHIKSAIRGIAPSSILLGIVLLIIVTCLIAVIAYMPYTGSEISKYFQSPVLIVKNFKLGKLIDDISKKLGLDIPFSVKLVLRKPANLVLIFVSVFVYLTLIIMSVSLNKCSDKIYNQLLDGRKYDYKVVFENNHDEKIKGDATGFILEKGFIYIGERPSTGEKPVEEEYVYALNTDQDYFVLKNDMDEKVVLEPGYAVINERLSFLYKVEKGDYINIKVDNDFFPFIVEDIATNANFDSIYVNLDDWNDLRENPHGIYNGMFCDNKDTNWDGDSSVQSWEQYVEYLNDNNVSNRISAIINQVLGVVFGILLIFLAILLNFQDNTMNYIYLKKLGYLNNEIRNMLVNIYFPFVIVAFIISILPAIGLCKKILIMLSINTGDYMPFITNIGVFMYAFIMLLFLYFFILKVFDIKLAKYLKELDEGC
ncbi:FtsX-like permease family protein [Pseudobutyrivibrio sp. UC1225]|uniref:ABC transporter permease n=1 Tax=Pseudobutyrivibrio sp. UC1225 TaxID=1798185 RepID=UPI0008F2CC64|nr:ABC transporter permease [Pseudobutyrivibrio sp. UC1225]SFO35942.1 FtsX-like permease family protein [Pseudobutyrivibrio sp. UC1225]